MSRRKEMAKACLKELGVKITEENLSLVEDIINDSVDEYWQEHYVHPTVGFCVLCGNTGIIDTTLTAIPPNGTPSVGGKHFCVCPNGQNFRKQGYDANQAFKPKA